MWPGLILRFFSVFFDLQNPSHDGVTLNGFRNIIVLCMVRSLSDYTNMEISGWPNYES